MIVVIVSS